MLLFEKIKNIYLELGYAEHLATVIQKKLEIQ